MNSKKSFKNYLKEMRSKALESSKRIAKIARHYLNVINPLSNSSNEDVIENKSHVRTQKHGNITWIDIENPTRKETNELAEAYEFDTLHLRASLSKGQFPRIETEEKYVFIILQIPDIEKEEGKVTTEQVCVFLGKNYLITTHNEREKKFKAIFRTCEKDSDEAGAYFKKSPSYLLYVIMENVIKDISFFARNTSSELDDIEDLVFDVKVSGAHKISKLRQKLIRLRRIVGLLKNIVMELSVNKSEFSGDSMSRYYKNLTNSLNKIWETLEEARETGEIYKDADFTVSTEKTNKILKVLTIVFTLTIPTTIIGTIYGMNVLLPGGIEAGSWTYLGPFTAFYFVIAISVVTLTCMLGFFKYKNWF